MIYCPLCRTANRHGSKFCNECGGQLDLANQKKCPKCKTLNPIADPFCNECGEPLSPSDPVEGAEAEVVLGDDPSAPLGEAGEMPVWLGDRPISPAGDMPGEAETGPEVLPPPPVPPSTEVPGELPRIEPFSEGAGLLAGIQEPLPAARLIAQAPAVPPAKSGTAESASEIVIQPLSAAPLRDTQLEVQTRQTQEEGAGTAHPGAIESILAIDCGSTLTRVFLFSLVEGLLRLVAWADAPSSLQPPWSDMAVSVRQALDNMASTTGLRILDELGQVISPEGPEGGVDAVVSATSASKPLRLVVAAPTKKPPMESIQHALSLSYAMISGLVTADGQQDSILAADFGSQIRLVQELAPDAIVIVGGEDGSAPEPVLASVKAMALACDALSAPDSRPPIIVAGDASLQPEVSRLVGDDTRFQVVGTMQPGSGFEHPSPLRTAIQDLYHQHRIRCLPGYETVATWDTSRMLPTARALARATQMLAQNGQAHQVRADRSLLNSLVVDVGGATTTAVTTVDGSLDMWLDSELGTSHNAARILDHVSLDSVLGWLPFEIDPSEARNSLYNKELRPHTLPQTRQDLFLEQALVREILGWTMAALARDRASGSRQRPGSTTPFDLIVGTGGVLGNAPDLGLAALMLLDGLQPVGICRLALDRLGLAAMAGAVAAVNPLAATQILEQDALFHLGTVIAPRGTAGEGKTVLTVKLEHSDGRAMEMRAPFGSLCVIPLPAGQRANLEIQLAKRFELELGTRARTVTREVEGGALGIIIDARGRPLLRARGLAEQQASMRRWLSQVGSQLL